MVVLKFRTFEDMDTLENQGKGLTWQFTADEAYMTKALRFGVGVPFPRGVYKFTTFEEANVWEREWCVKRGSSGKIG